jgi:hypothetical protein
VICVQRHGETVTDIAGTTSAVWLKVWVSTQYSDQPYKVYVPYAAVGYARTGHVHVCH